ncbi:UNVERIFIED_CONTAM: hypothetical protein K2H54_027742 [Gekko kuhli]
MQTRKEERPSDFKAEILQLPFVTVTSNKPVPEETTAEVTVQVKIENEESEIALQLLYLQTTEPLIPKKRAVLQNLKELPEATPTELRQLTEVKLLDEQGEDTLQELFIFLRDVTHRLVIDKRFRDFAKLADWNKVPEYETVIQQPIDLSATVSKIDLICSNAPRA